MEAFVIVPLSRNDPLRYMPGEIPVATGAAVIVPFAPEEGGRVNFPYFGVTVDEGSVVEVLLIEDDEWLVDDELESDDELELEDDPLVDDILKVPEPLLVEEVVNELLLDVDELLPVEELSLESESETLLLLLEELVVEVVVAFVFVEFEESPCTLKMKVARKTRTANEGSIAIVGNDIQRVATRKRMCSRMHQRHEKDGRDRQRCNGRGLIEKERKRSTLVQGVRRTNEGRLRGTRPRYEPSESQSIKLCPGACSALSSLSSASEATPKSAIVARLKPRDNALAVWGQITMEKAERQGQLDYLCPWCGRLIGLGLSRAQIRGQIPAISQGRVQ
jgi:hypothetical protein